MAIGGGDRMEAIVVLSLLMLFMLSMTPTAAAASMHPEDYLALQTLRKSLSDLPGSTFLSSWDFTSDPCSSFPGVLCSPSSGRILSLSLGDPRASAPGLSGRLDPSTFPRLPSLSSLSLVPGRVSGPIPHSLPSSLRFLALSHNLLSGRIPPSLILLPRLQTLDLRHNRLFGQIPFLPQTLTHLSLSNNLLSGRIDCVLPSLRRLSYLDLSINRFSGQIPPSIFSFPSISVIQLQRNALSGEIPIRTLVYPQRVDLSHNRLWGTVPAALAAAGVVYLNNNRFSGEVPAVYWERVRDGSIRMLYLQHNFLTGMAGIGAAAEVPAGTTMCVQFNCMVPRAGAACPLRVGRRRRRPAAECSRRRR